MEESKNGVKVKDTKSADLESGYTNSANSVWASAYPEFANIARCAPNSWADIEDACIGIGDTNSTDPIWIAADPELASVAKCSWIDDACFELGDTDTANSIWGTSNSELASTAWNSSVSFGLVHEWCELEFKMLG